jgi:endonuclease YncB( thermonuclease family)
MMLLTLKSFSVPRRGGALVLAAACFAAGLTAGALIAPVSASRSVAPPLPPPPRYDPRAVLPGSHPAEVLRVIDGDTFEARVHVWPGMEITTRVRLRGIDAPELHARCAEERVKAIAAREALLQVLGEGAVGIARIGQDKYGGRVDADASTAATPDVGAALLARGVARRYDGGRRANWCG